MKKRFTQEEHEGEQGEIDPSINVANVLILLSQGIDQDLSSERVFECRTCSRKFSSFQALGGHRASHKKRKVCNEDDSNQSQAQSKPKVHECSICGVEFAIGQALGGHMRRHRAATNGGQFGHHGIVEKKSSYGKRVRLMFDLNLTPPVDDDLDSRRLGLSLDVLSM